MSSTKGLLIHAHQLEQVYRAAVVIAGTHDVNTALQKIVDAAREIAGAEVGALGVPGEPGDPMAHFVVSGLPDDLSAGGGHAPMGRGVLGVLLNHGESLRLANLADHPAYQGYPDSHPHIGSFLGVPVLAAGEIVGDLYLANKIGGGEFSEADQQMIEMLASHAGAVIQNLRYQVKAAEVARLREHEALGRELQDNVLQTLYGSGLLLGQIDLSDRPEAAAHLREVQSTLGMAVDYLRGHLMRLSAPPDGDTVK